MLVVPFSKVMAQTTNPQSGIETNANSPKPQGHKKEDIKKKEKHDRQAAKAEAAERKEAQKIQDKATRKRMKQSQREANRNNGNKKEFFLKRWFSHKH